MANCRDIEQHFAAYVDGEAGAAAESAVDAHLARCPPCRTRVAAERAVRELVRARRGPLRGCAPDALRARCAGRPAAAPPRALARRALVPLSLAASLLLAAAVFVMFGWGSTVETYAAQIAADHVKCSQFPPGAAAGDPDVLLRNWETSNGWSLKVASLREADSPQLVAIRRCGSTKGRVAHIFYKWRGEPVSVYVLNARLDTTGAETDGHGHAAVSRFGERALVWTDHGRTYAVVAPAGTRELERVARYVRRTIE
jgi:anti-sigma factor RsiW